VDESQAVLERLARIEKLERRGSDTGELVAELRALLLEAEAWSRREGVMRERRRFRISGTRWSVT